MNRFGLLFSIGSLVLLASGCATQRRVLSGVEIENLARLQAKYGTQANLEAQIESAERDMIRRIPCPPRVRSETSFSTIWS
jgi:hypothetical protein